MARIFAKRALLPDGWAENVTLEIDQNGRISDVQYGVRFNADENVGILLPAISNVHSHSFQRAMAGLAEKRGPSAKDDFWTWRKVMYRFLELLTPDDIENIAAFVQMEMLEAGYAAQAEFHYVHHAPGGHPYDAVDETSQRHLAAAQLTGIGYTHLPVLYSQGGLDGRELAGSQQRFGNTPDEFEGFYAALNANWSGLPEDFELGVAPHSLRAVSLEGLHVCLSLSQEGPIHIHAAEQVKEVKEVFDALGTRPVRWLLDHMPVDERWCFIHATHLDDGEVNGLANSGAVAGLCPLTEANLGDGIFRASEYLSAGGSIGIGSDSNINIALSEELRMLEVSQRLRDKQRIVLSSDTCRSNGRYLYQAAARGGAQALGRASGAIAEGYFADLVALDETHIAIAGLENDTILDTWIMACGDELVSDVWAAGRHVVSGGSHNHHKSITDAYSNTMVKLRGAL